MSRSKIRCFSCNSLDVISAREKPGLYVCLDCREAFRYEWTKLGKIQTRLNAEQRNKLLSILRDEGLTEEVEKIEAQEPEPAQGEGGAHGEAEEGTEIGEDEDDDF